MSAHQCNIGSPLRTAVYVTCCLRVEHTIGYLGIGVDDALEMSEQTEI